MKRWLGVLLLVVALPFVMADSCGNAGGTPAGGTSSGSSAPKVVAVGQAMTSSDGLSVTVVKFTRHFHTGNSFDGPKTGNELIQVTYKLVNGSKQEWSIPLLELALIDSNGQKYQFSIVSAGEDNVDSLAAGGHADAVRQVYEVPLNATVDVVWVPNQFESATFQTALK